jgi:hypothetical protein
MAPYMARESTLRYKLDTHWHWAAASHDVVCHSKEEYARKENGRNIHANTVAGFFSILKRITGEHLQAGVLYI